MNQKLSGLPVAGLVALAMGFGTFERTMAQPQELPNILFIVPDDLGWNDIGYHGSEIKTPNLDKLAESGLRLNQHYVMPTCTPTRVSLMTGKFPSRYGITGPDYGEVIDKGDPTLASILKDNGYFTAIAGKWHLGSPPYTPLMYGFESSYGYFDGQIDPYTHEYKAETELTDRKSWHRNDIYLEEEGHVTDLLTAEAIRIIEDTINKPFFLYLTHHVPHYPLDEPDEWLSVYEDKQMFPSRKLFAASVTHFDDAIGKVIAALERAGKRKNTLIVFSSDNGGQYQWHSTTDYHGKYANKPHDVLGNNFPLRGWKGDLYEGGIRVPAFINWPGTVAPGVLDLPVHIADWLPTICSLVGCKQNLQPLNLDGRNVLPVLMGEQNALEERALYWKTAQSYAVRKGDMKLLVHNKEQKVEVYDLKKDFRESNNISKSNPQITNYLLKLLEEFKKGDR